MSRVVRGETGRMHVGIAWDRMTPDCERPSYYTITYCKKHMSPARHHHPNTAAHARRWPESSPKPRVCPRSSEPRRSRKQRATASPPSCVPASARRCGFCVGTLTSGSVPSTVHGAAANRNRNGTGAIPIS
ncbi:hypothetical protein C2E23DRAFT_370098 [Lenzites betulinus]|nr:hypothetical protein C2E23DRAFT_370098 [Lenzites betulinus]